jgi:hypothetical protein
MSSTAGLRRRRWGRWSAASLPLPRSWRDRRHTDRRPGRSSLASCRGRKPALELVHRSDLSIDRQVTASGATWLDRQLVVREPTELAASGFGRAVRDAIEQRRARLSRAGSGRSAGAAEIRPDRNGLRARELARVAGNISAANRRRTWRPAKPGDQVSGVYQRRVDLVSGRFAMIDDGLGFPARAVEPGSWRSIGQGGEGHDEPRRRGRLGAGAQAGDRALKSRIRS